MEKPVNSMITIIMSLTTGTKINIINHLGDTFGNCRVIGVVREGGTGLYMVEGYYGMSNHKFSICVKAQ